MAMPGPEATCRRDQRHEAVVREDEVRAAGLDVVVGSIVRLEAIADEGDVGAGDVHPAGTGVEITRDELDVGPRDVLRAGEDVALVLGGISLPSRS